MNVITSIEPVEIAKFSELAKNWWDTNGALKTLHDINPVRLDFIKSVTPSLSNIMVLDIGCGGGILSESLAKEGAIVTGIDAEPKVINAAKLHSEQNHLTIDYHCCPVEEFRPLEEGCFDVITCMEMLEHVVDPAIIIRHASRLLKPGGRLYLSTINRTFKAYASVIIAAEYVLRLLPRQTHDYQKFIKPSELARIARACKLEVESIKGMAYNPFTREASLSADVEVNYLLSCRKEST